MCSVLGVSSSAYYEWEAEQESAHERRDAELLALIRAISSVSTVATEHRAFRKGSRPTASTSAASGSLG